VRAVLGRRVDVAVGLDRAPLAEGARVDDLGCGEDYGLLACMPSAAREIAATGAPEACLTWVGRVLPGPAGVTFTDAPDGLRGYEHAV